MIIQEVFKFPYFWFQTVIMKCKYYEFWGLFLVWNPKMGKKTHKIFFFGKFLWYFKFQLPLGLPCLSMKLRISLGWWMEVAFRAKLCRWSDMRVAKKRSLDKCGIEPQTFWLHSQYAISMKRFSMFCPNPRSSMNQRLSLWWWMEVAFRAKLCRWSDTRVAKKEVSRALSIFLSLSVRTKESNLFPYFKLELSCHPLLDPIKVIQIFLR